ncbi:MAG: hypothetical protein FJY88_00110 [Candidatus Eisenbacteria bacterium]|nr:hypothetical protein [Candidatus Eisenbacteria bacterium]
MLSAPWFAAGALVWLLCLARRRGGRHPGDRPLAIGSISLGATCFALGALAVRGWEPVRPYLLGLTWGSVLLGVPTWVAFSSRFGRPEGGAARGTEAALASLLWLTAIGLLIGGVWLPPLAVQEGSGHPVAIKVLGPLGRVQILYALVGLAIALWNLQGTLEAARLEGRRRIAHAIYALLPVHLIGFYLLAEMLLYGERPFRIVTLFLPGLILAIAMSMLALGRKWREELSLPVRRPLVPSPSIVTALGLFLIGLALISKLLRRLGETEALWYEAASALLLAGGLALWVFPGLRIGLQTFLDRHLYPPSLSQQASWERLERVVQEAKDPAALMGQMRRALRSIFGPIHLALWVERSAARAFLPVEDAGISNLAGSHPLVRALSGRAQPLVITGDAASVKEVPLHVACEELQSRHRLRVFFPIVSRGRLVAILGCGPGEGRAFHPEDLKTLGRLSARLAPLLGAPEEPGDAASRLREV